MCFFYFTTILTQLISLINHRKSAPMQTLTQQSNSAAASEIKDNTTLDMKTNRQQMKAQLIPFEIEYPQNAENENKNVRIDRNVQKQARIVIIVTSCLFFFGFNRAMIAAVMNSQTSKQFQKLFNFTGNVVTTKAFLSVMSPMGALCGTIACSFLIKYYSPKSILFTASMLALIFTLTTLYTEIIVLMIFRFGIGCTVGTFVAIIPSFIKQITSKNVAPYFGTAPVINESLGGLVSFSLGYMLYEVTGTVRQSWIIMCCLNVIPLIIILICLKTETIYESPLYLLRTGDKQEAKKIYEFIYQPQFVRQIMKEKQMEILRFHFTQLKMLYNRNKNEILRRKDMAIAIHLPILRKMTGILIIVLSTGSMIKSIDPQFERLAPIFISLVYFISCFMSNLFIKYLSRRAAFQIGTISICICNLAITIGYIFQISILILVFKALVIIMYGLTLGPLVWPYLPEVVPARVIPLAQSMNWAIDCFTLSLPGVIIAHHGNPWPLFLVFFLWDLGSIFINHFFLVETKKKSLSQIIESLDKQ